MNRGRYVIVLLSIVGIVGCKTGSDENVSGLLSDASSAQCCVCNAYYKGMYPASTNNLSEGYEDNKLNSTSEVILGAGTGIKDIPTNFNTYEACQHWHFNSDEVSGKNWSKVTYLDCKQKAVQNNSCSFPIENDTEKPLKLASGEALQPPHLDSRAPVVIPATGKLASVKNIKATFSKASRLGGASPQLSDGNPYESFTLPVKANRTYQIRVETVVNGYPQFQAKIWVENQGLANAAILGKQIALDEGVSRKSGAALQVKAIRDGEISMYVSSMVGEGDYKISAYEM